MARIFMLKGDINRPGHVDIPEESTTLREVVEQLGGGMVNGKRCKAVQIGGPSGGLLSAEQLDLPLHFQQLKPLRHPPRRQRHHRPRRGPLHGGRRLPLHAVYADGVLRQVRFLPRGHQAHERAFVGAAQLPAERGGLLPAHGPRRDDLRHRLLQPRARLVLDAAKRP